jgi:glycerophosphoryl diester phosphodiesterase
MGKRPLLLGHRGARATRSIPENTLASFDLALAHGCDGFEFDVRRTADGQAVVCHDPRVKGRVVTRAAAAELAGLATLEQVCERYSGKTVLDIEMKVAGLEKDVSRLVARHLRTDGLVVSSFLPEVLRSLEETASGIPRGLICETPKQLQRWKQLSLQAVMPHYSLVTGDLVKEWHGAGLRVFVWTVNRAADMLRFAEQGVDGIISDDTELLVKTFS